MVSRRLMTGSTPGAAVAAGQQQAGVWCSAPVLCLCVVFGPLLGLRVLFMACFVRWWWRSVASLVNWWWWWWYAVRCQIGLALALALALAPVLSLRVMFGCVVPLCGVQGLFCAFARCSGLPCAFVWCFLSFAFLSFPFLYFPFPSFPFLSFPFLSFPLPLPLTPYPLPLSPTPNAQRPTPQGEVIHAAMRESAPPVTDSSASGAVAVWLVTSGINQAALRRCGATAAGSSTS